MMLMRGIWTHLIGAVQAISEYYENIRYLTTHHLELATISRGDGDCGRPSKLLPVVHNAIVNIKSVPLH